MSFDGFNLRKGRTTVDIQWKSKQALSIIIAWWSLFRLKRPGRLTHGVIQQKKLKILHHPPYNPDLSPCDFHVFGPMKKGGKR